MSRLMGKPTICQGENKGADQLRVTAKLISAFVFATRIVQFLLYLIPKFQASSLLLCLYSSDCVGPGQKPHCWFSHDVAHILSHIDFIHIGCFQLRWLSLDNGADQLHCYSGQLTCGFWIVFHIAKHVFT